MSFRGVPRLPGVPGRLRGVVLAEVVARSGFLSSLSPLPLMSSVSSGFERSERMTEAHLTALSTRLPSWLTDPSG